MKGEALAAALNVPLNRRDFLKSVALLPPVSRDTSGTLSDAFSTDVEVANHAGGVTAAIATINDEYGITSAIYSVTNFGELQKIVYDPHSETYEPSVPQTLVPMHTSTSIVGVATPESPGNERIAVGGYNFSSDNTTKYPAIAISSDGCETFETVPLEDKENNAMEGMIEEMKKIPFSEKMLIRIGREYNVRQQYGILDMQTKDFVLVTNDFEDLPMLDDLYVDPEAPTILYGSGRVKRPDDDLESNTINDFVLDTMSAEIYSSVTRHNIPFLDDVQVFRDEKGVIQATYALQSFYEGERPNVRRVYQITPGDDGEISGFDYDPLDVMLVDSLDKNTYLNSAYVKHGGITVRLRNIHNFSHGTWVTGEYQVADGQRPFAAYWQLDKDALPKEESLRIFDFDRVRAYPSAILEEGYFANLYDTTDMSVRNGEHKTQSGLVLDLGTCGITLISLESDFRPSEESKVLYEKK